MEILTTCAICGKEFMGQNSRAKYCSPECKRKGLNIRQCALRREEREIARAYRQARRHKKKKVSLIDEYLKAQANGEKLSYGYWIVERERRAKENGENA